MPQYSALELEHSPHATPDLTWMVVFVIAQIDRLVPLERACCIARLDGVRASPPTHLPNHSHQITFSSLPHF
ncbi:hypothetical protein BD310DRAFT_938168 [Dichomitus squalens]|uniref:Uncharacterized protein n=1 Tax=Dichomitus squalens TaxID=114155 RepID=A0A4Q9PHT3_9APHY|nr:hypothetical protein BD310DRAFT_938168 [Dichomitus squalens]